MNLKYFLLILLIFLGLNTFSQGNNQQSGSQFFAQFTYDSTLTAQQITQIEQNLGQNTNIYMARLDEITKGVYIITNNLQSFDENTVVSWLGVNFSVIDCYRQGLHGVDVFIPFNSNFCSSAN